MPITRTKKDNLVETLVTEKKITDLKEPDPKGNKQPEAKELKAKKVKKPGFLKTTIAELRKVNWPSFGYVVRWSSVILCFTILFSIFLGGFDHAFTVGVKFIECSSPKGKSRDLPTCSRELLDRLTFRAE